MDLRRVPAAVPAAGPGDPGVKVKTVNPAPVGLGPGDSTREKVVHPAPVSLGPGDAAKEKPLPAKAPRAFGPGDIQVPRPVMR